MRHALYLQNTAANIGDLATPTTAVEYAVTAEEAGWDAILMADALGGSGPSYVEPWITQASIAAKTERILLGTWIVPVPRRQPWQIASNLATLDRLSDGRVVFGAGLGAPWNYESTGIDYEPVALGERYDEALEIIVQLWEGSPVSYEGTHFSVEELEIPTTPVQAPRIPVMAGCWWPNKKPIHRAARWDGLMPVGPSFYGSEGVQGEQPTGSIEEELVDIVRYYREEAGGTGEILVPIDVPEAPEDFIQRCRDLDVEWAMTTALLEDNDHEGNLDRIAAGPPE